MGRAMRSRGTSKRQKRRRQAKVAGESQKEQKGRRERTVPLLSLELVHCANSPWESDDGIPGAFLLQHVLKKSELAVISGEDDEALAGVSEESEMYVQRYKVLCLSQVLIKVW